MNQVLVESTALQAPAVVVVQIEVDLDLATCDAIAAQLLPLTAEPGYEHVVIDVFDLFVSARGLAVLAHAVLAAAARGRTWAVAGLSRTVLRRLAGEWFPTAPMFTALDEAVRAVAGGPGPAAAVDGRDGARADGHADVRSRLGTVLAAATRVLDVDDVGVMLLDEHDDLRVLGSAGAAGAALEAAQSRLGTGPGPECVARRGPVAVSDLAAEDGYARLWEQVREGAGGRPRAVLSVPLSIDGDVVGNVNAVRVRPHPWTEREVAAVEAYAGTVALILRHGAVGERRPRPADP